MKQLLILSGKGGTGKTTVASAFIKLSASKAYADCDVDAPNLHLIMNHDNPRITEYFGMKKAFIDTNKCDQCDLCKKNCRFDAIFLDETYKVNNYNCEGCGVCEVICPFNAISMVDFKAGDLMLYSIDETVFSTAELQTGSGNSGMLVTEVKKQIKQNSNAELAIIDGSPGIGCPVMASISGVNVVVIVAEPSVSGISDMKRIIETSINFKTKLAVCVNKYDTNMRITHEIEMYCVDNNINFIGKIPYDFKAVKAINNGYTIVDIDCAAGSAVRNIYKKTIDILND